jgi:hypothetical protein
MYEILYPNRVIQPDAAQLLRETGSYYMVSWERANEEWGKFRCDPLAPNVAYGKRDVQNIIYAAYNGRARRPDIKFRNFQECLEFCNEQGIRIYRCKNHVPVETLTEI